MDLTVRLSSCRNSAPVGDPDMDAMPVWDAAALPTCSLEECEKLSANLLQNGYIFVRMSTEELQVHQQSREAFAAFWALPESEKNKYYIGDSSRRWGYRHLPYMRKEYFKVRKTTAMKWPPEGPLKERVMNEYEMFDSITKRVLECLARRFGFAQHLSDMLAHDPARSPAVEMATSFGEAFLYHGNPTDEYVEPCPTHSDMGLLTIIPPGDGPAALELFNWSSNWQNVETSSQMRSDPRVCVVFPGDLLSAITNNYFQATPHRVVVRLSNVSIRLVCVSS